MKKKIRQRMANLKNRTKNAKQPSSPQELDLNNQANKFDSDQDSSASRGSEVSSYVDEEEGEETTLNQSQVQEGPKGGHRAA